MISFTIKLYKPELTKIVLVLCTCCVIILTSTFDFSNFLKYFKIKLFPCRSLLEKVPSNNPLS